MSKTLTTNPSLPQPSNAKLTQEILTTFPFGKEASIFRLTVEFKNYSGDDYQIIHSNNDLNYTIVNGPATSKTPQLQTKSIQFEAIAKDDIGKTFSVSNTYKSDEEGKFIAKTKNPFEGTVQPAGDGDA